MLKSLRHLQILWVVVNADNPAALFAVRACCQSAEVCLLQLRPLCTLALLQISIDIPASSSRMSCNMAHTNILCWGME